VPHAAERSRCRKLEPAAEAACLRPPLGLCRSAASHRWRLTGSWQATLGRGTRRRHPPTTQHRLVLQHEAAVAGMAMAMHVEMLGRRWRSGGAGRRWLRHGVGVLSFHPSSFFSNPSISPRRCLIRRHRDFSVSAAFTISFPAVCLALVLCSWQHHLDTADPTRSQHTSSQ